MSRSYERMNIVFSFGFSAIWRRQMLRLIPPESNSDRVIDLMSGMGETWGQLAKRFQNSEMWALDFSPRMIEHAQSRNRSRFGGKFQLLCQDVLDAELPESAFDVVVSAYGVKTFDEEQSQRFAAEVAKVLKPGGSFAFIEVTEPPNRLLRWLYDFYLSKVLPVLGPLLVSDPVEYRMLHRYLRAFGRGDRTWLALSQHPDLEVERRLHFFGCATSFSGSRVRES